MVIDGLVEIGAGTVIMPGVTIGLREGPRSGGLRGPTIGKDVEIGTGAKILGPITLHRGARIGANAVVLQDVPPAQPPSASRQRFSGRARISVRCGDGDRQRHRGCRTD